MSDHQFEPFEGRDVATSTIAVMKAGDGLSKALQVRPAEYHQGERVFVVLETVVSSVGFPVVKDTDLLIRHHTLQTELATVVDEKLVRKVLDSQRAAIAEAAGTPELPIGDDDA